MRINYNVSAMISNNALSNSDNLLAKSLERLSSGLKINRAKDNPAGLAMAKRMNAQIEGVGIANQNAGDGISVLETADGALTEVSDMLQRMNELAIKAANGTMSDSDRATIQDEITQLKEEITRVSKSTEFNGQKLLNGEFAFKGYTNNIGIKVNSYTQYVPFKTYNIESLSLEKEVVDGEETGDYLLTDITLGADFPDGVTATCENNMLTLKGNDNFEIKLDLDQLDLGADTSVTYSTANGDALSVDCTGIGPMRLQIGSNEGQIVAINIPDMSLRNYGIEDLDVTTEENANKAVPMIEGAIQFLTGVRSQLGAYQNRLESTINSLDITSVNMTAAYSRIMDVDMAEEMTTYTTNQVLTQAGTSMLAQANERPSQVLQLLQ
ncbi:MAG: flagellin FliC3 [Lachnospiraceae bacterium]|nr:flagellin FliC3 [Lachnospiraceae bacterium]